MTTFLRVDVFVNVYYDYISNIVHIKQEEAVIMEKSVTRKDIAREADVSISVVSRSLNNSGYVEKEKNEK